MIRKEEVRSYLSYREISHCLAKVKAAVIGWTMSCSGAGK